MKKKQAAAAGNRDLPHVAGTGHVYSFLFFLDMALNQAFSTDNQTLDQPRKKSTPGLGWPGASSLLGRWQQEQQDARSTSAVIQSLLFPLFFLSMAWVYSCDQAQAPFVFIFWMLCEMSSVCACVCVENQPICVMYHISRSVSHHSNLVSAHEFEHCCMHEQTDGRSWNELSDWRRSRARHKVNVLSCRPAVPVRHPNETENNGCWQRQSPASGDNACRTHINALVQEVMMSCSRIPHSMLSMWTWQVWGLSGWVTYLL